MAGKKRMDGGKNCVLKTVRRRFVKKAPVLYSLVAVIALCVSFTGIAQAAPVSAASSQKLDIQKLIRAIPLWNSARKISASGVVAAASTTATASIPPCLINPTPTPAAPQCYSPQQMRKAYDVTGLLDRKSVV